MNPGDKAAERRHLAAALLSYVAFAVVVLQHLWAAPQRRLMADNGQDQVFFEWVLTHAARLFTHGDNPFFTDQLNAPLGVNLMANTSVLGLGLPLAPITLLFGAGTTFVLIDTIALAATAGAWYFVLSRHVVGSRIAAYVGGLFCGFAPSMISQSTSHPNIAGQFLIPFIVWNVLRLRDPGPPLRRGLALGAVVLVQCFINEEILFLTAVALLIFLLAYLHPRDYAAAIRNAAPALGIAVAFTAVLLAYPLYHQFAGPQAYHGLPDFVHTFSTDLASFTRFSSRSIFAPDKVDWTDKMGGRTEENTFLGLPLVGLLAAAAVALVRVRAARAVIITALAFAALSLGSDVKYQGEETGWTGPWRWMHELPLLDSVVPTRLALVVTPLLGVFLALLIDRYVVGPRPAPAPAAPVASTHPSDATDLPHAGSAPVSPEPAHHARGMGAAISDSSGAAATLEARPQPDDEETTPAARWLWAVALAVALFPLIPTPQPASERDAVPAFFTSGAWRKTIPANSTVVPVPLDWYTALDAMQWSTETGLNIKIVGGYFLAPDPNDPKGTAMYGAVGRPTLSLLGSVGNDGNVPQITPEQQAQARADADYWKADFVVLPDRQGNSEAIHQAGDRLFGPAEHVMDVWIWRV
ncbi:hypothetical protein AB0M46_35455 [Dactylosporangium sp. NPDC051485]|uniref:hypothetical protein n=1 Tax=Dactylosporangium sp. NPDC051485 TaxID=3154846 RepID=UPI003442CF06